jgi:hypothetical protein
MTDDQIISIVQDVDSFLTKETQDFQISMVDLSAIINSRLRIMSISEDLQDDYDSLIDHLNSQTVVIPKTIH